MILPLGALRDAVLAVLAMETRRALACVAVGVIFALATMTAWGAGALVHVLLTALANKTCGTFAGVASHFVNTGASIQAGV